LNASDETSKEPENDPAAARADRRANGDSCSSTARGFRLSGPAVQLDPRTHAYRSDLADIGLAGRIIAPHYARAMPRAAIDVTPVLASPDAGAEQVASLAPGAVFAVLEFAGGWAWGFVQDSHLVGYVPAVALGEPASP
jgi:hypothetical protein